MQNALKLDKMNNNNSAYHIRHAALSKSKFALCHFAVVGAYEFLSLCCVESQDNRFNLLRTKRDFTTVL